MFEMRVGDSIARNPTVIQQSGEVRPLGGQPNLTMEALSPATAWDPPKQEPMDEDRNDSGIASGSSIHSSPGSETSQDYNINNHRYQNLAHFATPIYQHADSSSVSPKASAKLSSQKEQEKNGRESSVAECSTAPGASAIDVVSEVKPPETDPLKSLEMSLEKNGLLSPTKAGEKSPDHETDDWDDQSLRVPKVNSHGKVKTFKCKHCDFVAITKLDFWEHSRVHIRPEKQLTCPKCPFLTEYKHHLEYHLRNHYGSKPFKCEKCAYSCVNKSMLNSHMKSHSTVYQYRCAECSYATKYCHSLKLHLRKYSHKPAMVLNPDGTPNPLPIIDVYGTRRGPKQKGFAQKDDIPNPIPQIPLNPLAQLMMNAPQLPMGFPYPFLGGFAGALANPLLFQQNFAEMAQQAEMAAQRTEMTQPAAECNGVAPMPEDSPQTPESHETPSEDVLLDLSKPETRESTPEPSRSRRKGMAFRLETMPAESEPDDDDEQEVEGGNIMETASNQASDDASSVCSASGNAADGVACKSECTNNNNNNNGSSSYCQYCRISFGDLILYTMHMGYHGFKDPFTCNMCGEQCNDPVSFFLHMARKTHS